MELEQAMKKIWR